jgi:hypothetical protein
VAVRPLPAPAEDLDERLEGDGGPVNVLSRWGAYGAGDPARASFSAITTTLPPRREPAIVWAITDRGVYERASDAPRAPAPRPAEALRIDASSVGALFVTAESSISLARLRDVLAAIPSELAGRVALAIALEPGTRLPAPPNAPSQEAGEALCPEGLPALPEAAPIGDLRADRVVQSLAPLRQGAAICVGTAQGQGAGGGRVVLAIRIAPDGHVERACASADETGDASLRECLAQAARAVIFPAPDPPGYVDVALPLSLAPLDSQRQRAICAD